MADFDIPYIDEIKAVVDFELLKNMSPKKRDELVKKVTDALDKNDISMMEYLATIVPMFYLCSTSDNGLKGDRKHVLATKEEIKHNLDRAYDDLKKKNLIKWI